MQDQTQQWFSNWEQSGRKKEFGETKYLEEVVEEDMEDDEVLGIFAMKKCAKDGHTPIYVSVMLGQRSCKMQLDTGATVSILPKVLYDQQFNQWPLRGTKISWRLTMVSEFLSMVKFICLWSMNSRNWYR